MKNPILYSSIFFLQFAIVNAQPDTLITEHNDTLPGYSWQFSFVHLTDVHIGESAPGGDYGSPGYDDTAPAGDAGDPAIRLRNSVRWINQNAINHKIKFVLVTGDLTDSGEESEFYKFKEIMDSLNIPYIPLIGNHDVWPYTQNEESPVPNGDSIFKTIFATHFDTLKSIFPNWDDGTRLTRIWNSEEMYYSYLQNFSFEYENYVFILADFDTRKHAPLGEPGIGPEAQLMDFTGGSWQWIKQHIATHPSKGEKNMFLFSHHPVIKDIWAPYFSFSTGEYDSITQYLDTYKQYLGIWFAGHIHRVKEYGISTWDLSSTVIQGVETAANKDYADGHFRIVNVWGVDSVPAGYVNDQFVPALSPKVSIYPNPNEGEFTLEVKFFEAHNIQIKIFDILGRDVTQTVILPRQKTGKNSEIDMNLNILSPGLYNLQVFSNQGVINKKIIVEQ